MVLGSQFANLSWIPIAKLCPTPQSGHFIQGDEDDDDHAHQNDLVPPGLFLFKLLKTIELFRIYHFKNIQAMWFYWINFVFISIFLIFVCQFKFFRDFCLFVFLEDFAAGCFCARRQSISHCCIQGESKYNPGRKPLCSNCLNFVCPLLFLLLSA